MKLTTLAVCVAALGTVAPTTQAQNGGIKKFPTDGKIKDHVKIDSKVLDKTKMGESKTDTKKVGKFDPRIDKFDPKATRKIPPWMANRSLLNAPTVDAWFEAMPNWNEANKPRKDATRTADAGSGDEQEDGRNYTVTRTKYSITDTPDEIVTFMPVNGFWLGGLVQEKGLQLGLGSMNEIGVEESKRAPFRISSDLPIANNYRDIAMPSVSQVSSAIGSLLQSGGNAGGALTTNIIENYSAGESAFKLGLTASYLTASIRGTLETSNKHSEHSIAASFIQRACTMQADFGGRTRRRAFFNDAFTMEDARALVNQERVTTHNLPAYIKSITFGRVVLFNLTSTLSEDEMKAALSANVNGVTWSAGASADAKQKTKSTSFALRVTAIGGGQTTYNKLIPATGIENVVAVMNSYLNEAAPLSSMVPISYTANSLRDDQLAALSRTTQYTVTKSVPHPIGERYKVKMWVKILKSDDGAFDNTFECYGTLRVNGDTWWDIPRGAADSVKREKNQTLEISEDGFHVKNQNPFTFDYFYDGKTPFKLSLLLRDADGGSKDDTFGDFNKTLDLSTMVGQTNHWDWDSGHGEASRVYIRVDRVDYL